MEKDIWLKTILALLSSRFLKLSRRMNKYEKLQTLELPKHNIV